MIDSVRSIVRRSAPFILAAALAPAAQAAVAPRPGGPLARKEFARPDLFISSRNAALDEVLDALPNRAAWQGFSALRAADGSPFAVFIDPRSGTATNILGAVPLIPGGGVGNTVTLGTLAQRLGMGAKAVDAELVGVATLDYVRTHAELLGIDTAQLGRARVTRVTTELWQVSIPQQFRGVPVRFGRIAASISHGNLVTIGTSAWGNVALEGATPAVDAEAALHAGFAYVEGQAVDDAIVRAPALEVLPFAPAAQQKGEAFVGPVGSGYGHRLAWAFAFRRRSEPGTWEVTVDARSGEVLSFRDIDEHAHRRISGGVYPLTDTEYCYTPESCGIMQPDTPMPFADTGLPAPNNFTNGAGTYEYPGGTATTTLSGKMASVNDSCGTISQSSASGSINLGGVNGDHGCVLGGGHGNSPAARTAFYEVNKMAEIARGYLPFNTWLQGQLGALRLTVNPGLAQGTCNAGFQPGIGLGAGSITFFSAGDDGDGNVCRNTGELASVIDHEWGHGLDDHDANPGFSVSSEGYADIAAIYRTQTSCLGPGFFASSTSAHCGGSPDGTGPNVDEADITPHYCATSCSGVRDADFAKHDPPTPATAEGFVCNQCFTGVSGHVGPCGREEHCDSAPARQAAWDLAARDLAVAPFGYESNTAFIVANRLFYQGSGNIGSWYTCACGGTSNGCAVDNAYMQWVTADDDNGNLNDGTPHMTAIFNAFDRHGIACKSIPHVNSGCGQAPAGASTLAGTPGGEKVTLDWTSVPGATRYQVFRTEGPAGCDYGKVKVGETTGLTFSDPEVSPLRPYSYVVVPAGTSDSCLGRASNCVTVSPEIQDFTITCSPASVADAATTTCTVHSEHDFASPVTLSCAEGPGTASCTFSPATVTPSPNGTATTTLTITPGFTPPGQYTLRVRGTPSTHAETATTVRWTVSGTPNLAAFDTRFNAPSCAVGASCDTGTTLIHGRGSLGPEPNAPNTIHAALQPVCNDGSGTFFPNNAPPFGSVDRILVYTGDGTVISGGKRIRIDATVQSMTLFADQHVDIFASGNGDLNSAWSLVGSAALTRGGSQVVSATYTLPRGSLQVVRVQLRYQGTPTPCYAGPLNDRDDLVFVTH